jgi:hypothetical protein
VPPESDGAAVWSTPAIDPATGRLYVGTGNNYHEPTTETSDAIIAFDAATGQILDLYQATPNDSFAPDNLGKGPDYDFGASPNLFEGPNGELLVGEGQKSGVYWALDRATMEPLWSTEAGPGGVLGGILGSTAYDGTRIYGGDTLDGRIFALERDGAVAWNQFETAGAHFGSSTVANGVLYTPDPAGFLTARDPASGAILNKLPLGGPAFGGVSAVGGAVYVAVGSGPPPAPAPQQDGSGSIVAFGDASKSGARPQPPSGRPRRRARIRLKVRPHRVRAQRRVVVRFRTTRGRRAARRPLRRVKIHLRHRVVRTHRRGRARMSVRFRRARVYRVRAKKKGLRTGRARIRVVRAR